jgi:hypothetical protein
MAKPIPTLTLPLKGRESKDSLEWEGKPRAP